MSDGDNQDTQDTHGLRKALGLRDLAPTASQFA
jgi:hypothetical protein